MSEITLRRQGNLVEAIPGSGISAGSLHELLRGSFKYFLRTRNDRRTMVATGQKFRSEVQYLCQLQRNEHGSSILFPAGLLQRAQALFQQCSVGYTYRDLRSCKMPDPALDKLQMDLMSDRDDQLACLAALFTSDMGVVDGPTGLGKTFLIEQMCRAYPGVRMVICSYRTEVVRSIYDRLLKGGHVPFNELGAVGGGRNQPARVTVATIDSLEHADPQRCQIFLYDEVHEAASPQRVARIATIRDARMFGFSASPTGRSDGSDMVVEATFGPVIYRCSYQEAEAEGRVATISVDVHRVPGAPIPYDDDTAQYRYGIWRNDARNSLIAQSAKTHLAAGKQVLIMVDKVEHALTLKARFLHDWQLVHGSVNGEQARSFKRLGILPDTSWLCHPDRRDGYRKDFEKGRLRMAIVTGVWGAGVNFVHLDVLIRADGRSSAIPNTQIPGRLSRGSQGLLVDFLDSFDERFKKRSQVRIRSYTGKGWKVVYR